MTAIHTKHETMTHSLGHVGDPTMDGDEDTMVDPNVPQTCWPGPSLVNLA